MPVVVGVTFRKIGKVYYFDPDGMDLQEGEFVISETAHGLEFGEVVLTPREVPEEEVVAPLKKVIRIASKDDLDRENSNRDREKRGMEVCEQKIAQHNLPMKLLDAECSFDGTMITFSFSAEGRIDFRELVKDVAGILKTRVQLHQIGVRDEARIIGGYGACGRSLCCATFLTSFEPVSMKMAKDQSLFLNPAKFSGCCGKLLCCLRYEQDFYKSAHERLPSVGAILQVGELRAKVVDVNVISDMLTLETEDGAPLHINANKIQLEGLCRKHGISCGMVDRSCHAMCADDHISSSTDEVEDDDVAFNEVAEQPRQIPQPPRQPNQQVQRGQAGNAGTTHSSMSGIKFRDINAGSDTQVADAPSPALPVRDRRDQPARPSRPNPPAQVAPVAPKAAPPAGDNSSRNKRNRRNNSNRGRKPGPGGKPEPRHDQNNNPDAGIEE